VGKGRFNFSDVLMFIKIATFLFGLIAVLHALRLIYGWEAVIGGWAVPTWFSGLAVVIAGLMVWGLRREAKIS
jgi:hypothetical protein